jgi:hypothetical protein
MDFILNVMVLQKVVTSVKTGVQSFSNYPKTQDSGIRRNDDVSQLLAFCENTKGRFLDIFGEEHALKLTEKDRETLQYERRFLEASGFAAKVMNNK